MIDVDQAIAQRHSVRNYKNIAIGQKAIADVLNAGRCAPSAKNRQPWRFKVADEGKKDSIAAILERSAISEEDESSTVAATASIVRKAPVIIVVFLTSTTISDYISLGACLENMSLKATDLGLGSLIICDTQCCSSQISGLFSCNEEAVALFALGYEEGNSGMAKKLPLECLTDGFSSNDVSLDVLDNLPEADIEDKPFIFISYSHKDAQTVVYDIIEMKKHGVRLWYDRSILCGEKWDECALNIIRREHCVGVMVYVSENSLNSENVAKEIECASQKFRDEKASIIGIHIGGKLLSQYRIDDGKCAEAFTNVFTDENIFIPRGNNPVVSDDMLLIVEQAKRLGAVDESGVYDEFKYRQVNEGIEIVQYNGSSVIVKIPSAIAGLPVVSLGKNAFQRNAGVHKVVVPYSVKQIDEGVFAGMKSLEEVVMSDNVTRIGVAAFRECSSLKSIRLPENLTMLEEALFRECTSLKSVVVPHNVTEFGEAVFRGCVSLEYVSMPSVKTMTEGGFYGCLSLRKIEASAELSGLEEKSFETCPNLNAELCGFRYRNGKSV